MEIKLSDHFSYGKLLRFTIPTIGTMILISVYSIVDGYFVSNFAGKTPFAALNLIYPLIMVLGSVGFMLGSGGTAIVTRLLGKGKPDEANAVFSMLVYVAILLGTALGILGILIARPASIFLGASEEMLEWSVLYCRIIMAALPALILQFMFQPLIIAAERPKLGFWISFAAGMTNIVGDALLVGVFDLGLKGAAIASAASMYVGGLAPLIFFLSSRNNTHLRLGRMERSLRYLGESCFNGSSELLANVAASVVSMCYNFQLMKYLGENGVAAYGVVMYVMFIFIAIFVGYSSGIAPVIGFNYGAANHQEQKSIFSKSMKIIAISAVAMVLFAEAMASPLAVLFVGYDTELCALTEKAFRIYSLSFLLCGFNIYGSAMFTGLSNGKISAVISFFRTLVCETVAVMLLPLVFGINGIWFAIVVAESVALCLTTFFVLRNRSRYGYL